MNLFTQILWLLAAATAFGGFSLFDEIYHESVVTCMTDSGCLHKESYSFHALADWYESRENILQTRTQRRNRYCDLLLVTKNGTHVLRQGASCANINQVAGAIKDYLERGQELSIELVSHENNWFLWVFGLSLAITCIFSLAVVSIRIVTFDKKKGDVRIRMLGFRFNSTQSVQISEIRKIRLVEIQGQRTRTTHYDVVLDTQSTTISLTGESPVDLASGSSMVKDLSKFLDLNEDR